MGIIKNSKGQIPPKPAPQMNGKPAPASPPPITKLPENASDGTATGAPMPEKGKRAPRALLTKDMPDGAQIREVKTVVTVEGINFKVSKFNVVFDENDARNSVKGSLRDALSYWHTCQPRGAKSARKADPMGTLALLRAGKAIKGVCDKRAPEMRDALNAALAALRSDLDWQISTGVDVAKIEAAEVGRIAKMADARTAKKNATPAAE